jgi:hypothetical protein
MNPYDPPKSNSTPRSGDIDADIIERLIDGNGTQNLAFYDVSDHQLYGRKKRRRLTGEIAKRAADARCDTIVYQSVLWWCFVFIPIVPLGVYAVIPKLECDDPDGDADQYRGIQIDWDWRQIAIQYAIVGLATLLIGGVVWLWWSQR